VAGERVGLLRICCYRPFPNEEIRLALAGMRTVAVLDRALAPGARPPLLTEVAASLYGSQVRLRSYVYGLGGRDLLPQDVRRVYADLTAGGSRRTGYLGLKESS
jgi:pyruvate ferredoxin oxidoreductase alpha subunit